MAHIAYGILERMKATAKQGGFTLVETMIVLAVTGALFLLAVVAINGKQNETAFQQSINDMQSVLQQIISQVGAGDYQNTNNFTCNGTAGALNIQPGNNQQGSNTGCVFLGKAVQFGVSGTNPQQYITYPIAGLQDNSGNLAQSTPTVIAPGATTNTASNFPNASVGGVLHNGLTAVSMDYVSGATKTNIGAVAFVSSLGQYSGAQLISGSQQLSLIPVSGSGGAGTLNTNPKNVVDAINKFLATSPTNPSGGVEICFASGTTNQSGLITIGSNGRSLSVSTQVKDGKSC